MRHHPPPSPAASSATAGGGDSTPNTQPGVYRCHTVPTCSPSVPDATSIVTASRGPGELCPRSTTDTTPDPAAGITETAGAAAAAVMMPAWDGSSSDMVYLNPIRCSSPPAWDPVVALKLLLRFSAPPALQPAAAMSCNDVGRIALGSMACVGVCACVLLMPYCVCTSGDPTGLSLSPTCNSNPADVPVAYAESCVWMMRHALASFRAKVLCCVTAEASRHGVLGKAWPNVPATNNIGQPACCR